VLNYLVKKNLKYLLILGTTLIVGVLLFIQYLISDFHNPYDKAEFDKLKAEINNAEKLPSDFQIVFDEMYPVTNTNGILIDELNSERNRSCPCLHVAYMNWNLNQQNYPNKFDEYILSWKLEKEFSQNQCLKYLAYNHNFLRSQIGIDQASAYYFEKKLNALNKKEFAILTLMIRNANLYDPIRNMHGIESKLSEINN